MKLLRGRPPSAHGFRARVHFFGDVCKLPGRRRSVHNHRPPAREVEIVDTEVRRATEGVVGDVVVHDDVPTADGVEEDALPTRRIYIIVRPEDELARAGLRELVACGAVEGTLAAGAAADEDLVLVAGVRAGGGLEKGKLSKVR